MSSMAWASSSSSAAEPGRIGRPGVRVLDAGHLSNSLGRLVLRGGDVAQSDRSDQALVAHGHHGGYLFAEGDPSFGMATEVDHGYLVELQGDEVGQYPFAQLLRALRLVYAAGVVATGPYFDTSTSSLG